MLYRSRTIPNAKQARKPIISIEQTVAFLLSVVSVYISVIRERPAHD